MKKGFTILELVVVISVLVILIGIAIPRIKGMQQSGQIVQAKAELQTMQTAMESYYNNLSPTKAYPPTSTGYISPCLTFFTNAVPQIVPGTCPTDPFAAAGVEYKLAVNGNWYVFGSIGPGPATDLSTLAVSTSGAVTKANGNICATNGTGC